MTGATGAELLVVPLTIPAQPFNKTGASVTNIGSAHCRKAVQIFAFEKSATAPDLLA